MCKMGLPAVIPNGELLRQMQMLRIFAFFISESFNNGITYGDPKRELLKQMRGEASLPFLYLKASITGLPTVIPKGNC
jgi:hypothetical protein